MLDEGSIKGQVIMESLDTLPSMTDLRSIVFRDVTSREVPLNYQFGALLGYSLEVGPMLVEALHPDLELEGETDLIALQSYSELNDALDGGNCELDMAFGDRNTILGIESKRGSTLKPGQLERELRVLERNADDREVILLTITDSIEVPRAVEELQATTSHTVRWTSWRSIALRLQDGLAEDGYKPLRFMMNDLLDDADYTLQFSGFPHPALDSDVYLEWLHQFKNLVLDVDSVLGSETLSLNRSRGQNMPSFTTKSTGNFEKDHYQPAPIALFVPFSEDPDRSINNYGHDSHVSLYGNYHDDEVGVFLDLNPKHDGWSETVLRENRREITDVILEEEMFLRISRNSHCNYNFSPRDLRERDEILEFLDDRVGSDDGKRVMIGRTLSEKDTPRETIDNFASEITFSHSTFFEVGSMLGQYREA